MSIEQRVNALIPQPLQTGVLRWCEVDDQEYEVNVNGTTNLCWVRVEDDVFHVQTSALFQAADDYHGTINDLGREFLLTNSPVVNATFDQYEKLGLYWSRHWHAGHENDLLLSDFECTCETLDELARVLGGLAEMGTRHPVHLPESPLINQVHKALGETYTIEWSSNVTDFRLRDKNSHEVMEYDHDMKTAAFGMIIAEWDLEDGDDVSEMASQLGDYAAHFFTTLESRHPFTVLEVQNVAGEEEGVAAIDVGYTTHRETLEDLVAAIEANREIMADLTAPDWLP